MSLRVSRSERRVFRGAAKELFCKAQQVLGRPGVLTRMLLSFLLVLAAGGVFLLFSALFGAFSVRFREFLRVRKKYFLTFRTAFSWRFASSFCCRFSGGECAWRRSAFWVNCHL